jgi:hypothetical protein
MFPGGRKRRSTGVPEGTVAFINSPFFLSLFEFSVF